MILISNPDLTLFYTEMERSPFRLAVGDLGSRLE